eukprot:TRINITY_DN1451_c0_g1_i1.p1 TRINITY_DN1451_c0_g1~~TRINITY_DN1451_c0_g1_i1.p1  ORF type:complete len:1226 (-),score=348.38 TRINITY_DN1451_c0_g1_i1:9-3686(-)
MKPIGLLPGGVQQDLFQNITFNESYFAVASTLSVYLYSFEDYSLHSVFGTRQHNIVAIYWSPHRISHLAVLYEDGLLIIWNIDTLEQVFEYSIENLVSSVTFHPVDTDIITVGQQDGLIHNISMSTGKSFSFTAPTFARVIQWDKIGKHLLVGGSMCCLFRVSLGKKKHKLLGEINSEIENDWVCSADWDRRSPDYFGVAFHSGHLFVRSIGSDYIQNFHNISTGFMGFVWAPESPGAIVTLDREVGVLRFWNVSQSIQKRQIRIKETGGCGLRVTPSGELIIGFQDGSIAVAESSTGRCLFMTEAGHTETVFGLEVHPQNPDIFSTSSFDGSIGIWRVESRPDTEEPTNEDLLRLQLRRTLRFGQGNNRIRCIRKISVSNICVYCHSWNKDGIHLVCGDANGFVFIVNVDEGRVVNQIRGATKAIYSCLWVDNFRVAFGSQVGGVAVWNWRDQNERAKVVQTKDPTFGLTMVNNSNLAVATNSGLIKIFGIGETNLELLSVLKGHTERVFGLECHPMFPFILASSSDDNTVRVWDLRNGECVCVCEGHCSKVRALCWSPVIPSLLLSGSWDRTIRIWDVRYKSNGQCLRTLFEHCADVYAISIHPKRPFTIFSTSRDTTTRMWTLLGDFHRQIDSLQSRFLLSGIVPVIKESAISENVWDSFCDATRSDIRLGGDIVEAFWNSYSASTDMIDKYMKVLTFFGAPIGLRNLLYLVLKIRRFDNKITEDYKRSVIIPYVDDILEYDSEYQKLCDFGLNPSKYARIGQAKTEDVVAAVAQESLLRGDLKMYAKAMIQNNQWLEALAFAGGVSFEFYQEILNEYLANESNVEFRPHAMIAAGKRIELANEFSKKREFYPAFMISSHETELIEHKSNTVEVDTLQSSKNREELCYILKKQSSAYLRHGEVILAACCYLSFGDVSNAVLTLANCGEIVLAHVVQNILPDKVDRSTYIASKMLHHLERLFLYSHCTVFSRALSSVKSNRLLTEIASRVLHNPIINDKQSIYNMLGFGNIADYKEMLVDNNDEEALCNALLGDKHSQALSIGNQILLKLILAGDMKQCYEIVQLLSAIDIGSLETKTADFKLFSYLITGIAYLHLSEYIGYTTVTASQKSGNDPISAAQRVHAALLAQHNLSQSQIPLDYRILKISQKVRYCPVEQISFSVFGLSHPLDLASNKHNMSLLEYHISQTVFPFNPFLFFNNFRQFCRSLPVESFVSNNSAALPL